MWASAAAEPIRPRVVTEPTKHDTDDPAIWVDRANPAESLVLGTDKDIDGALYVWGLDRKIRQDRVARGLVRPNNVDIACDVMIGGRRRADRHGRPAGPAPPPRSAWPVTGAAQAAGLRWARKLP